MRRYLLGNEVCGHCGQASIVVNVTPRTAGLNQACSNCGQRAARVAVYFDAAPWPEVELIVRFDVARRKLNLPELSDALWH